jgi:hypothetical protein
VGEGERAADGAAAQSKDRLGASDLEESPRDAGDQARQGTREVEQAADVDGAAERQASSAQGAGSSERSRVAARQGQVMRETDAPKDYLDSRATIEDSAPSPSSEVSRQVEIAQRDTTSRADAPKEYLDSRATIEDSAPSPSSEASRQVEIAQRDTTNRSRNNDLVRDGEAGRDFVEDPADPLTREGKKKFDV